LFFKERKMRKWIIFLGALLMAGIVSSQVKISGRVLDGKKKPVSGVSISIKDLYDGATTDSAGNFSFISSEKGSHTLIASSIGYLSTEVVVNIVTELSDVEIILKDEINELKAVVISAGTFEASDRKKGTVLSPIDIVTTASGNADVVGALKSLPGAQQIGESEGLFVRGGTATETKTFIDGTLVNNFFFSSVPNIAQRGRFSPFIFKGTIFSTGGYSALYGQALSSALILESIDIPDQTSANLGLTIIGVSCGYQHLAKDKKSSVGINYDYTDLRPAFALIKQNQEYEKVPIFHSADANFRIRTSKNGILKYYGTFSTNQLKFYTPSLDTLTYKDGFALKNLNTYHNLFWRENLGKGWKMQAGLSYTYNRDDIQSGLFDQENEQVMLQGLEFKNFQQVQKGNYFNAKLVFEKRFSGMNVIRFGSEHNGSYDASEFTSYNGRVYPLKINEKINSVFAETDIYITNDLAAKIGGRFEHSALLDKTNLAPRISLAYKTGKNSQASIAYGVFYQNPERIYPPANASLIFSKATHYIAQYQKMSSQVTFRVEVFYKKYHDLVKTIAINGQQFAADNNGYGDAKGFELFWRDKKTFQGIDYWISYSFLDTKRDFMNFPYAIQPSFAAKHTASLIVKKFVTKWKTGFNGAYNYASGRPYYFISNDIQTGKTEFTDMGKTPDYNNVSFSLNFLPALGKKNAKMFGVYVISISNVFNFDQIFGYQYSYNGLRKEAIVPPSKMFLFIGAFLSFGVDRSEDAININL
jgi:vitamin B12 transporter